MDNLQILFYRVLHFWGIFLIFVHHQIFRKVSLFKVIYFRGGSHIDFRTQCVMMTLGGWGWAGAIIKFRKIIDFQSS